MRPRPPDTPLILRAILNHFPQANAIALVDGATAAMGIGSHALELALFAALGRQRV